VDDAIYSALYFFFRKITQLYFLAAFVAPPRFLGFMNHGWPYSVGFDILHLVNMVLVVVLAVSCVSLVSTHHLQFVPELALKVDASIPCVKGRRSHRICKAGYMLVSIWIPAFG
jgi:hypothetical protein